MKAYMHILRRSVAAFAYTGVMIAFLAYCSDKKNVQDHKTYKPELAKESKKPAKNMDINEGSVTL